MRTNLLFDHSPNFGKDFIAVTTKTVLSSAIEMSFLDAIKPCSTAFCFPMINDTDIYSGMTPP